MKKNILISTGGSGGHVIPAKIFYDHLKDNFNVLLTSDKRGCKFISQEKYKLEVISSPRISLNIFKLPFVFINLFFSILKSLILLKKRKIDTLLGTGGYMSVPVCIAAKILNIKIYLFEPNMVIGRANKFLLKFSDQIFCYSDEIINFPKKYKNKIFIIERILRKEIYDFSTYQKEKIENKIKLLIVGGSQGAKIFDEELQSSIIELSKKHRLFVYHQSSSLNLNKLKLFYNENNIECELFNFEENFFKYIKEANFAITRAGASTMSELAFLQVPFLAIPYYFATDNHQLHNAIYYKNKNCCWLLKENELNRQSLTTLLYKIIENKEDYSSKKNNLHKFCYQNTWNNINQKLADILNEN